MPTETVGNLCDDCALVTKDPAFLTLEFERILKQDEAACRNAAQLGCKLCQLIVRFLLTPIDNSEAGLLESDALKKFPFNFSGPIKLARKNFQFRRADIGSPYCQKEAEFILSISTDQRSEYPVQGGFHEHWREVEVCIDASKI